MKLLALTLPICWQKGCKSQITERNITSYEGQHFFNHHLILNLYVF